MAAASSCQLQNNTMIQTRCYPSSLLCIRLCFHHTSREMSAAAREIKVLSSVNLNDDVGGAERRHFGFLLSVIKSQLLVKSVTI